MPFISSRICHCNQYCKPTSWDIYFSLINVSLKLHCALKFPFTCDPYSPGRGKGVFECHRPGRTVLNYLDNIEMKKPRQMLLWLTSCLKAAPCPAVHGFFYPTTAWSRLAALPAAWLHSPITVDDRRAPPPRLRVTLSDCICVSEMSPQCQSCAGES